MKRVYSIIGMMVSIIMVIMGILIFTGLQWDSTRHASRDKSYDSGYAEFGADFYSYVNNNAADAATGSIAAANYISTLNSNIGKACGLFFIFFGLLSFCLFGNLSGRNVKSEDYGAITNAGIIVPASTETTESVQTSNDDELPDL